MSEGTSEHAQSAPSSFATHARLFAEFSSIQLYYLAVRVGFMINSKKRKREKYLVVTLLKLWCYYANKPYTSILKGSLSPIVFNFIFMGVKFTHC